MPIFSIVTKTLEVNGKQYPQTTLEVQAPNADAVRELCHNVDMFGKDYEIWETIETTPLNFKDVG